MAKIKTVLTKITIDGNKLIAKFMDSDIFKYLDSGMVDINNVKITEGSIINADGYNSVPDKGYFNIVEFDEGQFGSNIYSDFEPLSRYNKIEVIGHCVDYIYLIDTDDKYNNIKWSLKGEFRANYHRSWNDLMDVVIEIEKLGQTSVKILGNYCEITPRLYNIKKDCIETKDVIFVRNVVGDKCMATWGAVVKFLELYSNNKL